MEMEKITALQALNTEFYRIPPVVMR